MTCNIVKTARGVAIVCTRPRGCTVCGARADKLCDFPRGDGKTCDAPLCARCAVAKGPERDWCPTHKAAVLVKP